jgi:hypothetical protein
MDLRTGSLSGPLLHCQIRVRYSSRRFVERSGNDLRT